MLSIFVHCSFKPWRTCSQLARSAVCSSRSFSYRASASCSAAFNSACRFLPPGCSGIQPAARYSPTWIVEECFYFADQRIEIRNPGELFPDPCISAAPLLRQAARFRFRSGDRRLTGLQWRRRNPGASGRRGVRCRESFHPDLSIQCGWIRWSLCR